MPNPRPRRKGEMDFSQIEPRSFHLTVCFYPIPALHFAENFAALPA
jgi:hypothetical protein